MSVDTDNQGVRLAMHKSMSTMWPLTALLAELSEQLRETIRIRLTADAITNGDCSLLEKGMELGANRRTLLGPWNCQKAYMA